MNRWLLVSLLGMIAGAGSLDAATIAYWQFDADGVANLTRASVGGPTYDLTVTPSPIAQSVFTAANPVIRPDETPGFLGDPATNLGSAYSIADQASYLRTAAGGTAALNLAGSSRWTTEGYFQIHTNAGSSIDVLFSTRAAGFDGHGMLFDVRNAGGNNRLSLFVDDGPTGVTLSTSQNLALDTWYHVALTFDGTAGSNGRFELFLDGTTLGSLALPAGFSRTNLDSNDLGRLELMGRSTFANVNSLAGRLDEWRISNTVLLPHEFLNAPIPEPSTWVLTGCGLVGVILFGRRRRRAA